MNLKTLFAVSDLSLFTQIAVLLVRVVVGSAMMFHGWRKIQNPFGWMGEDAWAPSILQALAALSEFGGGFALIIGLLMPLASFGIACTMAVATWTHAVVRGDAFVAGKGQGSFELPLVFFCISVLLIALGPGRFSLDRVIFGQRTRRVPSSSQVSYDQAKTDLPKRS